MKKFGVLLGSAVMLVAATSPASAATVLPTYTYNFTGTCAANDCAGFGVATLTLNTSSTTITNANFVGFSYVSNLVNFTISGGVNGAFASGALTTLPGTNTTFIGDNSYIFLSNVDGNWSVGRAIIIADFGPTHIWAGPGASSAAPEPATWATLVGGFGMIGSALRRRKVAVSFT